MVGWHHGLDGHELKALGVGHGQGSLECCGPRGLNELHITATELN